MKIKLLIATEDTGYAKHLSRVLMDRYGDTFEVSLCSSQERCGEMLARQSYDMALISQRMALAGDLKRTGLTLLLWDETERQEPGTEQMDVVRKYQRISVLAGDILGKYAQVAEKRRTPDANKSRLIVVWSPAGGTGKTTVALAYAARRVADGKNTTYLSLENFSSVPVYFTNDGKSISEAFEKLGSNLELLLQSIRQRDSGSGICYFCAPSNYDDINVLTNENLQELILAAGHGMDEVVVDLPSTCDSRCRSLFEEADTLFVVMDGSQRSRAKWEQFRDQHDVYGRIREKLVLVCNMGAQVAAEGVRSITLPYVRSDSPTSVYKSLSASSFNV